MFLKLLNDRFQYVQYMPRGAENVRFSPNKTLSDGGLMTEVQHNATFILSNLYSHIRPTSDLQGRPAKGNYTGKYGLLILKSYYCCRPKSRLQRQAKRRSEGSSLVWSQSGSDLETGLVSVP